MVKLIFLGHLKNLIGTSMVEVEISSPLQLKMFLIHITKIYPALSRIIDSDGHVLAEVLLLINGIDVNVYEDPYNNVIVENKDEITFVPISHGG
jgi:molybdopterin converting factor small subunit